MDAQLRLSYAREVLDANRVLNVASQDGTLFAAPGTSLPRSYLTTGVSVSMQTTKALSVALGYNVLFNTTHVSAQARQASSSAIGSDRGCHKGLGFTTKGLLGLPFQPPPTLGAGTFPSKFPGYRLLRSSRAARAHMQ